MTSFGIPTLQYYNFYGLDIEINGQFSNKMNSKSNTVIRPPNFAGVSFDFEVEEHPISMTIFYTSFYYKKILYKNIHDEIGQKVKNVLRISSS